MSCITNQNQFIWIKKHEYNWHRVIWKNRCQHILVHLMVKVYKIKMFLNRHDWWTIPHVFSFCTYLYSFTIKLLLLFKEVEPNNRAEDSLGSLFQCRAGPTWRCTGTSLHTGVWRAVPDYSWRSAQNTGCAAPSWSSAAVRGKPLYTQRERGRKMEKN